MQRDKFLRIETRTFHLAHPETIAAAGSGDQLPQGFHHPLQFIRANRFFPKILGDHFHDLVETVDIVRGELALRANIATRFKLDGPAVDHLRAVACALLRTENFEQTVIENRRQHLELSAFPDSLQSTAGRPCHHRRGLVLVTLVNQNFRTSLRPRELGRFCVDRKRL